MTEQEIFNTVFLGLKGQGFVRSIRAGMCMYRGPNGLKCAVGHLIPDEKYEKDFEFGPLYNVANAIGLKKFVLFLSDLQSVHDRNPNPGLMEAELHAFAESRGLTVP